MNHPTSRLLRHGKGYSPSPFPPPQKTHASITLTSASTAAEKRMHGYAETVGGVTHARD